MLHVCISDRTQRLNGYQPVFGFEFFQIWFYHGELCIPSIPQPNEKIIKELDFPVIFHATFNPPDFEKYGQRLIELLDYFEHNEVIIHAICETEPVTNDSVLYLADNVQKIYDKLHRNGIKIYFENNSVYIDKKGEINKFFNSVEDLRVVFDANPNIGLLLDVAHVNNYEHLKSIVDMRFPECIHIADKRTGVLHEHLPLGSGDMDFDMIFKDLLAGYDGSIILEAIQTWEDIAKSKTIIDNLFSNRGV